jgi:hypothetical protein
MCGAQLKTLSAVRPGWGNRSAAWLAGLVLLRIKENGSSVKYLTVATVLLDKNKNGLGPARSPVYVRIALTEG